MQNITVSKEGLLETVGKIIKKIYDTVVKMLSTVKKFILDTLKKLTNRITKLTPKDHKLIYDSLSDIDSSDISEESQKVTGYTDEDKSIAKSIISNLAKKIVKGTLDEQRVLINIIIANRLNEENPKGIISFTDTIISLYKKIKDGKETEINEDIDLIGAIKFKLDLKLKVKEVGYVDGKDKSYPTDTVVILTKDLYKYNSSDLAGKQLSNIISGGGNPNMTYKDCFERIVVMFKNSALNNFRNIIHISKVLGDCIDRLESVSKRDLKQLEKDFENKNYDISVIRVYGSALQDITRMFKALVRAISIYEFSYLKYYEVVKTTNKAIDDINLKFEYEMQQHSQESRTVSYLSLYKSGYKLS